MLHTAGKSINSDEVGCHLLGLIFLLCIFATVVSTSVWVFRILLLVTIGQSVFRQRYSFDLPSLIPVFTVAQLLVAPSELRYSLNGFLNYGPLNFAEYSTFAVPLVAAACVPFFFGGRNRSSSENSDAKDASEHNNHGKLVFVLLSVGVLAEIIMQLGKALPVISALAFYATLCWKISIPILLFHSKHRFLPFFLFVILVAQALMSTFWWDCLMFSLLTVMYGYSRGKVSNSQMVRYTPIAILFLVIVQIGKHQQRTDIPSQESMISTIGKELVVSYQGGVLLDNLLGRFNQGVNDSFVYQRSKADLQPRTTIMDSFVGALVPRFLFPDKPDFSSRKFVQITGYTGMGASFISLSGVSEAYFNYGMMGGCVFLFLFYSFLRRFWRWAVLKFEGVRIVLLVLPFFHLLRCEVDFYHWFSGFFNGLIVLLFLRFILKNVD